MPTASGALTDEELMGLTAQPSAALTDEELMGLMSPTPAPAPAQARQPGAFTINPFVRGVASANVDANLAGAQVRQEAGEIRADPRQMITRGPEMEFIRGLGQLFSELPGQDGDTFLGRTADAGFDILRPLTNAGQAIVRNATPGLDMIGLGRDGSHVADAFALEEQTRQRFPQNEAVGDTLGELGQAQSIGDFLGTLVRDPVMGARAIFSVGAESLPASAPMIGATAVAGPAGAGAVGSATEYARSVRQGLQDAGIDLTDPAAIEAALADESLMSGVSESAMRRGVSIGGLDAAAGGLAGRLLGGSTGIASGVARGTGELGLQMAGGGGGEALAQLASTGRISSAGEILLEAVAEFATAPGEAAIGVVRNSPRGLEAIRNIFSNENTNTTPPADDTGPAGDTGGGSTDEDSGTGLNAAGGTVLDGLTEEQIAVLEALGVTDSESLLAAAEALEGIAPGLDRLIEVVRIERANAAPGSPLSVDRIAGFDNEQGDFVPGIAQRLQQREQQRAAFPPDIEVADRQRLAEMQAEVEAGTRDPSTLPTAGREARVTPEVIQQGDGTTNPRREVFPDATAPGRPDINVGAQAANQAADRTDTQAREAFRSADRQRGRIDGDQTLDAEAAGRPEGTSTDTEIEIHEGFPVRATGITNRDGHVQVRRIDPRTGEYEADSTPYFVDPKTVETVNFTPEPRRAQDFVRRVESFQTTENGQRLLTPERERMADDAPPSASTRLSGFADPQPVNVQGREPGRTFSASSRPDEPLRSDGTSPDTGRGGPTQGRSPIPEQTENREGEAPFRPFTRAEEAEAAAYDARREQANRRDRAAEKLYEEAGAEATNEPIITDGDYDIDVFGYVISTTGAPVVFTNARQLGRALITWQQRSRSGQVFEPANYPGRQGAWTIRERGRQARDGAREGNPNESVTGNIPATTQNVSGNQSPPRNDGGGNQSRRSSEESQTQEAAAPNTTQTQDEAAPQTRDVITRDIMVDMSRAAANRIDEKGYAIERMQTPLGTVELQTTIVNTNSKNNQYRRQWRLDGKPISAQKLAARLDSLADSQSRRSPDGQQQEATPDTTPDDLPYRARETDNGSTQSGTDSRVADDAKPKLTRKEKAAADRAERLKNRRNADGTPQTLAQFLAERGGVRDTNGDLRSMGAHKWHIGRKFQKRLVTENGMDPDKAREAAEEAGYIRSSEENATTSVNDLLDALDLEVRADEGVYSEEDSVDVEKVDAAAEEAATSDKLAGYTDMIQSVADKHKVRMNSDDVRSIAGEFSERGNDNPTEEQILKAIDDHFDEAERSAIDAERASGSDLPLFDEDGQAQSDINDYLSGGKYGATFYSNPLDPVLIAKLVKSIYGISARGAKSLHNFLTTSTSVFAMKDGIKGIFDVGNFLFRKWQHSSHDHILAIANQYNSPAARKIADMFFPEAGGDLRFDPEAGGTDANGTFDEAVDRRENSQRAKLQEAINIAVGGRAVAESLKKSDVAHVDATVRQIARLVRNPKKINPNTPIGRAAQQVVDLLKDEIAYLKAAGVELGDVVNGYLPRVMDEVLVAKNPVRFVQAATRVFMAHGYKTQAEAKKAAEAWRDHILGLYGSGSLEMFGSNEMPSSFKGRTLSDIVDKEGQPLAEFYQSDLRQLLGSYFSRSARKAEWTRRMGNGNENYDTLIRQMQAEGVPDHQIQRISLSVSEIGGISARGQWATPLMSKSVGWLRTWNTLGLLDLATITSLPEAFAPAIRSGNALDGIRSIARTAQAMKKTDRSQVLEAYAEDHGLITNIVDRTMSAVRWGHIDPQTKGQSQVLDAYFRRTFLEQFTRATRIAAIEMGQVFIRRQLRDIANGNSELARRNLRELGVPDAKINDLISFVQQYGEMPTSADVKAAGDIGQIYQTAIGRFMDQSIMRPSRATRPSWAQNGVGSLVFQLQSFIWAFTRNILFRTVRQTGEALDFRGLYDTNNRNKNLTSFDRLRLMGPAAALGMYMVIAMGISNLRDELLLSARRLAGMTSGERAQRGLSRGGIWGQLDPYVNTVTGIRYSRSVAESQSGPAIGRPLGALENFIELAVRNSDNTNTAERAGYAALYDMLIEPAVNLTLSKAFPGAGLAGSAVTFGAGSGWTREQFVTWLGGPAPETNDNPASGGGARTERPQRAERPQRSVRPSR